MGDDEGNSGTPDAAVPGRAGTRPRSSPASRAAPKPAEAAMSAGHAETLAGAPAGGEPGSPVDEHGSSPPAERVALRLSAVGRIEGGQLTVDQGAVGAARADQVEIDRGALGAALAGEVQLSRGYARSILARQVQLDRSAARVIIAADVRADQSAAMFLVARRVDGNLKVLFDWRGALAFGAVVGAVFAIVSRLRARGR